MAGRQKKASSSKTTSKKESKITLPNITLLNEESKKIKIKDLSKNSDYLVLYFYPKDDTPGCTQEACDFRDSINDFKQHNCTIVGVSPDLDTKHFKFKNKHNLNFTLLADPDKKLISAMGVWQKKKFMGKEYMGVVRSTFLFKKNKLLKSWQSVRVKNHVSNILEELEQ